jgi:hypothetical protein
VCVCVGACVCVCVCECVRARAHVRARVCVCYVNANSLRVFDNHPLTILCCWIFICCKSLGTLEEAFRGREDKLVSRSVMFSGADGRGMPARRTSSSSFSSLKKGAITRPDSGKKGNGGGASDIESITDT